MASRPSPPRKAMLAEIAEANPDLPLALIRAILIARREKAVEEYPFG